MNAPRYQWKPRAGFFTTPAIAGAILVQANGGFEAWAGDGRLGTFSTADDAAQAVLTAYGTQRKRTVSAMRGDPEISR